RGGAALPNVAITRVTAEPDTGVSSRGIAVTAEIANFGTEPVHGLGISLRLGELVVARGTLDLTAGGRAEKRFLAALHADQRAADAAVEIDHDALAADDKRFLRAELRDQIRVLLV